MQKQIILISHRFLQERVNRLCDKIDSNKILLFFDLAYLKLNLKDSILKTDHVIFYYPLVCIPNISDIIDLLLRKFPDVKMQFLIGEDEPPIDLKIAKEKLPVEIEFISEEKLLTEISYAS